MHVWTDQPYETMWTHLGFLSHEPNARSLLRGELGERYHCPAPLEQLQRKARQLAYCVLQATEYYRAAAAVSAHTSPLLYFYGMLSPAKALIIANDPGIFLDDVKYHGLKRDKTGTAVKLEDQTAATSGGVFARLVQVVQGNSYPDGAVLRLKDLLSISPEICQMYERYFNEPSRCIRCYDAQGAKEKLQISTRAPNLEFVYGRLPELATDFDLGIPPRYPGVFTFSAKESSTNQPSFKSYTPIAGGSAHFVGYLPYLSKGQTDKLYLTPPLSDYAVMFILSDCVRYKQDLWGRVVNGEETGVLGLISLFLTMSKRRFPNFMLNQFFGERFTFGAPGYMV